MRTPFEEFAAHVAGAYGCRCTTVLLHHEEDAERLFSSDPAFVSPVGRKRFDEAPAMARMKANGKPQKFEGETEILAMFREGQKLVDTGFLCLVNLPVIDAGGKLQGQVNLALPEGRVAPGDLNALTAAARALAPELVAARTG